MKSELVKKLIHKVALKNNLPDSEVRRVVVNVFKVAFFTMSHSGKKENGYDYKTVLIPYFGKFRLNIKALNNARAKLKKEEDEQQD